jgi:transcriptional regulator with XRE-family HTH domain
METDLALAVRDLRKKARLSLDELAQRASVNRKTVMEIEAGGGVRLDSLQRVLRALGVHLQVAPIQQRRPTFDEMVADNEEEQRSERP